MEAAIQVPWIQSRSEKATSILHLLERVLRWRRTCGLAGASPRQDHFLGCFGNPDSDAVFLCEIPSLKPPHHQDYQEPPPEERWKLAWNVSPGDRVFRETLRNRGFINDDEKPWTWHCWITDFVKCAERDTVWKHIKRKQLRRKERILRKSASFLEEELGILRPKMIVVLGNATGDLFDEYVKTDVLDVRAPHYARLTPIRKAMFVKRFAKIGRWYQQLRPVDPA